MTRSMYRLPFLCTALLILVLIQAATCQAKEISVELVWKLGQAGWVEIEVEKGDYRLIVDTTILKFPAGSSLQVGWGGWAPVLRINHEEFQVFRGSVLEIKGINPGSLRVKTPGAQAAVYRGDLHLSWRNSHWQLVNRVDREDYLKGVVPIEMSNEWSNGGSEALKAQAVAARTFLVKHTENGKKRLRILRILIRPMPASSWRGKLQRLLRQRGAKFSSTTRAGNRLKRSILRIAEDIRKTRKMSGESQISTMCLIRIHIHKQLEALQIIGDL
jgi:Sporulation protein and related proteins